MEISHGIPQCLGSVPFDYEFGASGESTDQIREVRVAARRECDAGEAPKISEMPVFVVI